MTPANPDALADALAQTMWEQSFGTLANAPWEEAHRIAKAIPDGQAAWNIETVRRKASEIVTLHVAPILADLQRVTAERDEARATQRDLHRRTQKAERFRARNGPGLKHMIKRRIEDNLARRDAEAALAAAEARAAQLQAEVEAKDRAILLLLPFVDYAAGEGLMFVETEDGEHPEMDAADIMAAVAEALGLELGSDAYLSLLPKGYFAIRTALAAPKTTEGRTDRA